MRRDSADHPLWIDGESSQFGTLRILPLTQCQIRCTDILRDLYVVRIEFLRSLKLRQRALPFTAATVNPSAVGSGQSTIRLQFQRAVELRQRHLVLAMTPIKE